MISGSTRRTALLALVTTAFACRAAAQPAQSDRSLRLVVPFPPGGPVDAGARILANALGGSLHRNVIVENRAGAGGVVGTDYVAKVVPDGETLLFASTGAIAVNQSLLPHSPYDSRRDLRPVVIVSAIPMVLVVHPAVPARTMEELMSLARRQPLTYGTSGIGGAPHLAGELLKQRADIGLTHVPYRGAAQATTGLLGHEVDIAILDPLVLMPHVRDGRAFALAQTGVEPSPGMPSVPTMAEAGIAGVEVENWYALMAPAPTPSERIEALWIACRDLLRQPELRRQFTDQGGRIVATGPAPSAEFIRAEVDKWAAVVRQAGIKAD